MGESDPGPAFRWSSHWRSYASSSPCAPSLHPLLTDCVRLHLLAHLPVIQTECHFLVNRSERHYLQALKMEEGTMRQGTQAASGRWNRKGMDSPLEPPNGTQPCQHLHCSPASNFYRTLRKYIRVVLNHQVVVICDNSNRKLTQILVISLGVCSLLTSLLCFRVRGDSR